MARVSEARPVAPYAPGAGTYDEAITGDGDLRAAAAPALLALERRGIERAAAEIDTAIVDAGCVFRSVDGDRSFAVDAVPRVLTADEWAPIEAGLAQRVRALDAFVDDVHGAREAVAEGVLPERVVTSAEHLDPDAAWLRPPAGVWINVAGLDLVREGDGRFLVLEDNVRTPSGFAYALAAREAVLSALDVPGGRLPRPIDHAPALLLATLRAAAPPAAGDDPHVAVLSDGPDNSAWWEHRRLAALMGVRVLTPADVEVRRGRLWCRDDARRPVDVVYRRTDDASTGSWAGRLLAEPLAAGRIGVANAFGTGVADDKLVHAYVEDLVRFFLGEEPLLPSVRTLDPCRPDHLAEIRDRLGELVIKPRDGSGGVGVIIGPHADADELKEVRRRVDDHPEDHVAQDLVMLSTHPTAIDGALAPRHVDLRPFVLLGAGRRATVLPGGLTRVALDEGRLVVNSSQSGGAKDTWVMA